MIGSGKLEQMRWAIEVGEIDTVISMIAYHQGKMSI